MKEPSRSTKTKPIKWVKDHSNMLGFLITSRQKEKEVSPSISPFGNSKPTNITSPSLMLLDIETSSKT